MRALRMWMGEIAQVVAINERPLAAMAGESLTHAIVRFQSGKSASFDCLVRSVSTTAMTISATRAAKLLRVQSPLHRLLM